MLLFNLKELDYVSSAGVGTLLGALEDSQQKGGTLALFGVSKSVFLVFEMLGFLKLVENFPNEADGVAYLRDFKSGDVAVLYTDGLTEAMNPQRGEYDDERLHRFIAANAGIDAPEFAKKLEQDVNKFRQGAAPNDDMTMLVLKAD